MKYYAMIDGEQKGPFELEQLPEAGVRPSTYIWCKGMDDWEKAEDNADVCRLFRNRLYDLMHPSQPSPGEIQNGTEEMKITAPAHPSRFDRYLADQERPELPSIEEIEALKNTSIPPVSMVGMAWLATIFCFFPTGIFALFYAYRAQKAWKDGDQELAHDLTRSAKMMTGISFFMGFIAWSVLLFI